MTAQRSVGPSILFLNRVFPPGHGATGRLLAELAERLAFAGWRVTIVTDGAGSSHSPDPSGMIVKRTGRGALRPTAMGYAEALVRLIWTAFRQPRHDIVVTMTDPPFLAFAGPLLGLRHGTTVHWCHDLYPELLEIAGSAPPKAMMAALAGLSTWAMRRHRAVIVIGRCMARRVAARGIPADRIHVLPNWGQPWLHPAGEAAGVKRPFTVLYAGTLGLVHPVGTLVDCALQLAERHPEIRMVVVAEGRRRDAIAELAARAGLVNLTVLPFRTAEEFRSLALAADLHLALMDQGAAGLVVPCKVPAALACGRPAILAGPMDSDAARMLTATGAGWVVPARDGAALAEMIGQLAGDPVAVERAARAAAAVGMTWTADIAADAFRAICGGLIDLPAQEPALHTALAASEVAGG